MKVVVFICLLVIFRIDLVVCNIFEDVALDIYHKRDSFLPLGEVTAHCDFWRNKTALFDVLDVVRNASLSGYKVFISRKENRIAFQRYPIHHVPIYPNIPFLVHQCWKSNNTLSYSFETRELQNRLFTFTSDFLYILWTDEDIEMMIVRYFPHLIEFYGSLNMNIKRADLARYLLLIQFGGLYLDMDFQIDRPLGMLLTRGNVSFPLELISYLSGQYEPYYRASGNFKFIGNAFMAAIPNAECLRRMVGHILRFKHQSSSSNGEVMLHTGPFGLAQVVEKYLEDIRMKYVSLMNKNRINQNVSQPEINQDITPDLHFFHVRMEFLKHQRLFRMLPSSMVGNIEDHPKYAIHLRRHRWS